MRVLQALALVAVLWLSPAITRADDGTVRGEALPPNPTPAAVSHEAPAPGTSQEPGPDRAPASSLLSEAFTSGARAGAAQARPVRPRTVNARARTSNHGDPAPAPGTGRKVRVKAYAYHLRGFTARGTRTQLGTVAVDPRVIPMGSRLYIPGYGWGRAVDTGGAIQGCKIDVWLPTLSQCLQWGVRDVTVTVVP